MEKPTPQAFADAQVAKGLNVEEVAGALQGAKQDIEWGYSNATYQEYAQEAVNRSVQVTRKDSGPDLPPLENHKTTWTTKTDKSGEKKSSAVHEKVGIKDIGWELRRVTENWPRRIEGLLFYDDNGTIRKIENDTVFTSWLHEHVNVYWRGTPDSDGRACVTRKELFHYMQVSADNYVAFEDMPHEPEIVDHYYGWRGAGGYKPTGEYFDKLVGFFDNSETECDRELIRAMFCTPCWGGQYGQRPAIIITAVDRGYGKSTIADAVGLLYGGPIEYSLSKHTEDKFATRLLTPSALTKRVIRVDNIKGTFSSVILEGMITAREISGHRMYGGEASRPNTLTYVCTGNTMKMSRDLAERAFFIRLGKPPKKREGWIGEVVGHIQEHREKILADIVWTLRGTAVKPFTADRWSPWVAEVLGCCSERPDDVVELNRERREECDETNEECDIIMGELKEDLNSTDENGMRKTIPGAEGFYSTTEIAAILSASFGYKMSAKRANMILMGHIKAGRLPLVRYDRKTGANGFYVQNPK